MKVSWPVPYYEPYYVPYYRKIWRYFRKTACFIPVMILLLPGIVSQYLYGYYITFAIEIIYG